MDLWPNNLSLLRHLEKAVCFLPSYLGAQGRLALPLALYWLLGVRKTRILTCGVQRVYPRSHSLLNDKLFPVTTAFDPHS